MLGIQLTTAPLPEVIMSKSKSTPHQPPTLGMFDGREVIQTTIKVTNAGDGLSSALSIEPKELHHADVVVVVLECEVSKVEFVQIKDTDRLARVHTLRAGIATIVDRALVEDVLSKQRIKIEESQGVQRIPGLDPGEDPDTE